MHTGSYILDINFFLRAAKILFQIAIDFTNFDYIDFVIGFSVPYKKNDIKTDLYFLSNYFTEEFQSFCKDYDSHGTLILEPEKFLVSE
ncbi:hypothetical protein [Blattabacterium sp. (Cryptocercus punctulatus) str. Cpu]|uniref:hypothetical protein n=1 Tax=Blattabacterium sp. (Cryptocercus punctulatus) str. Cpu TaxID=1075399 RepID=UPI0002DBB7A1|nr:hypothetical protein [Blattabacterium sp. (Cryptocercus punctulatus) str. Cpu]